MEYIIMMKKSFFLILVCFTSDWILSIRRDFVVALASFKQLYEGKDQKQNIIITRKQENGKQFMTWLTGLVACYPTDL